MTDEINVLPFGRKPTVQAEPRDPYIEGPVKCLRCKHEWRGVMPPGRPAGLECPGCGSSTGVLTGLVEPEGERWVCSCECQLFFLDRIGPPMCAGCGVRAQSWVDHG